MSVRAWVCCLALVGCVHGCALIGLPGTNVRGCYPGNTGAPDLRGDEIALARFVAMGDFGTAESGANGQVAAALRQVLESADVPTDRVFELGDNFYYHGLLGAGVSCWNLPAEPAAVTQQALDVLQPFEFLRDRGITLTALPGNHDYGCHGQGLTNQLDIDRWLPPSHRWGVHWELIAGSPREIALGTDAVQVIVLDSERMITDRAFRDASADALEQMLAAGRDRYRWRVLAAHHPLQTNGAHDGAWWKGTLPKFLSFVFLPTHVLAALQVPPFDLLNQELYSIRYVHYREAVEEAVRRSGVPVALFLGGHDHQLQLLRPETEAQPFVLVSGSAAKCAPARRAEDTIFTAAKYGFAVITAYASHLDVEFFGTTACAVQAPCAPAVDARPHRLFRYRLTAGPGGSLAANR